MSSGTIKAVASKADIDALNGNLEKRLFVEQYGYGLSANTATDIPVTQSVSWKVFMVIGAYGNLSCIYLIVVSADAVKHTTKVSGTDVLTFARPNSSTLRVTSANRINITILDVGVS